MWTTQAQTSLCLHTDSVEHFASHSIDGMTLIHALSKILKWAIIGLPPKQMAVRARHCASMLA